MIDAIQSISASLASAVQKSTETDTGNRMDPANQAAQAGETFGDYVSNLSTTFVDNLKTAETKSIDGIMGKASVREVVESVMAADQTLQTALAFRDKIVSAYLEIVKMPI